MIIPPLDLKVYTVKAMVGEDSGIGEIFAGIVPFLLGCLFTFLFSSWCRKLCYGFRMSKQVMGQ